MTLKEAGKKLGITPEAVIYRLKTGKATGYKIHGAGHGRWNITSLGNGSANKSAKPKPAASANGNGRVRESLIVDASRRFAALPSLTVLDVVDWIMARGE